MRFHRWLFYGLCLLAGGLAQAAEAPSEPPADNGWPRVYSKGGQQVVVHQPQVDSWDDWSRLKFRAAVAVSDKPSATPRYGVLAVEATTEVDKDSGSVLLRDMKSELRFPDASADENKRLTTLVREALPPQRSLVVALDRLLPYLDAQQVEQREVQVSLDPPQIFYSTRPATLLGFFGPPEFKPVADSGLLAAANTDATVLLDPDDGNRYYLRLGDTWLSTPDLQRGPWAQPVNLPPAFARLPDDGWGELRGQGIGPRLPRVPQVFYTEGQAELLLTDGEPRYRPIAGTRLLAVSNSEQPLFLHSGEHRHYLLSAGRWFSAGPLTGPWQAATTSLPADFARIPDSDPMAYVLASVPGTEAAEDAVLLASVPQKATLQRADLRYDASYAGEPKFAPIEGTPMQYAVNAADPVIAYDGRYYSVKNGVWFEALAAGGPWVVCTAVPPALYTIPSSSPVHNVTYVNVYDSTPTTVTTGYTAGYNGQYVMNGLLLFGVGMALGYALHDHDDWWYGPGWYGPAYRSYGYGAVYRPGYGYARAGWASGPYGVAGGRAFYNPVTGGWARGGAVATPFGVAGGRAGYNPYTGAYGARIGGANAYGSWGRSYAERGGEWAAAGHRSGPRGNTAWVQTSNGGGAIARNGRVYAGKDGEIYRRTGRGEWQEYNGGGQWRRSDAPRSQVSATRGGVQPRDAQAREARRDTARAQRDTRRPAQTPRAANRAEAGTRPAPQAQTPRRANPPGERSASRPAPRSESPAARAPRREATPAERLAQRPQRANPPVAVQRDVTARDRGNRGVERTQRSGGGFSGGRQAGGARQGGGGLHRR